MKVRQTVLIIFFMLAISASLFMGFWKTPEILGMDGGRSLTNYLARYIGGVLMFWLVLFSLIAITRRMKIF